MPFGSIDEDCNAIQYYSNVLKALRNHGNDLKEFSVEQLEDQLWTISENTPQEIAIIVRAYRTALRDKTTCCEHGCDKPRARNGYSKNGTPSFKKRCSAHNKQHFAKLAGFETVNQWENSFHPYKKFRKDYCENTDGRLGFKCTTTITMSAMLQVDHIDGNPSNNQPENLQTLCACCHVHKTMTNKDYATPGRKSYGLAA